MLHFYSFDEVWQLICMRDADPSPHLKSRVVCLRKHRKYNGANQPEERNVQPFLRSHFRIEYGKMILSHMAAAPASGFGVSLFFPPQREARRASLFEAGRRPHAWCRILRTLLLLDGGSPQGFTWASRRGELRSALCCRVWNTAGLPHEKFGQRLGEPRSTGVQLPRKIGSAF